MLVVPRRRPGPRTSAGTVPSVPALDALADWPVTTAAAVVVTPHGTREAAGPTGWRTRTASVTKLLTAYACLVAVEEQTLDLEAPAGPAGSTVRHLLAHASGLPFEGSQPIAPPGARRIYSNTGFDLMGEALASAVGLPVQIENSGRACALAQLWALHSTGPVGTAASGDLIFVSVSDGLGVGVAAGADGLIIEVHNEPEKAVSDGAQSLKPDRFMELMAQMRRVAAAVDRTV